MSTLRGNPWAVLVTLSLGFFMTLLDLTIVNIAIPSMIDALNASLDEVLWVLNSYVLVLAVLLITAGRLGDLRGQRCLNEKSCDADPRRVCRIGSEDPRKAACKAARDSRSFV